MWHVRNNIEQTTTCTYSYIKKKKLYINNTKKVDYVTMANAVHYAYTLELISHNYPYTRTHLVKLNTMLLDLLQSTTVTLCILSNAKSYPDYS